MADAKSTVELIFQGVDKTGAATDAAIGNVQKFSQGVQNVTGPISDFTTSAIKLEAALLTAGAAVVGFSIKVAGDFDAAFREISTLIEQPVEDLDEFRRAILDYANGSTQPLENITQSIYNAISAGVDYADSIDAITQAENLSVAGRADLDTSLTILVSSLNAYGKGMEDAERFSDLLFTTVKQGQTTLPELSASLAQVTGLAATAGVSFDELLSAVAALTSTGTPTAQAITQIRGAISAIIKPSGDAATLAGELGIEFGAQRLAAVGLAGVLDDVKGATGGNVDQMARLFGRVEALGGVLTLTGLGANQFSDNLDAMTNSAGATEAAFAKMADSVQFSNQRVVNALRGVAIEIGGPLLESYGGVADAIAGVFNAVGANVAKGQLGGLVKYIESVFEDTEAVFRNIARNLPKALETADLSGFIQNIEAVREGISEALSGLDLNTVDGLSDAITLVADLFGQLGTFVGGAIESFGIVVDAAVKVAEAINKTDSSLINLAGSLGGVSVILDKVLPAFDTLLLLLIAARSGGIVAGAGKAATTLGTLGLALGKFAGPAGLAGVAGYGFGTLLADGLDAVIDRTTGSGSLGGLIYDLINGTEDWTSATVKAAGTQSALADETGKVGDVAQEAAKDYDALVANASMASDINDALAASFRQIGLEWDATTGQFRKGAEEIEGAATATEKAEESTRGWIKTIVDGVPTFTQAGKAVSSSFGEQADAIEDVVKKSESYLLKMEEIASDERIKALQFKVELDVAQIEADTRRVESAFESINTTINSTGTAITDLFGIWTQVDRFDQSTVMRQIEIENERRQKALDLQSRLTQAQIEALRARTEALTRGDALIQIDGTGLEPELEAFMWRILSKVRTRVNAEYADFLLGIEA